MSNSTHNYLDGIPILDAAPENAHPAVYDEGKAAAKYSREDYIAQRDGKVYGTWESSFTGACMEGIPQRSYIEAGAITSYENMGACSNKHNVIKVTMK